MKKLLLLLALVLSCGLASFAETAVFYAQGASDYPMDGENITMLPTGVVVGSTFTSGDLSLEFVKNNTSSDSQVNSGLVRFYKGDEIVINSIEGSEVNITKVVVACDNSSNNKYVAMTISSPANESFTGSPVMTWTSENGVSSITLGNTAQSRFSYIEVTYTIKASDDRKSAGLSFPESVFTVEIGKDFVSPVASAEFEGAKITYSIDNENVATINATTGALNIVGAGDAVVTAISEETEEYKEGKATYALVVTDPNKLDASFNFTSSVTGTSFTSGIVSAVFAQNGANTPPSWYSTGTAMRLYAGNTLTISIPSGYYLTAIEFTTHTSNSSFNDGTTISAGSLDGLNWSAGNEKVNSVVFTNGGTKGHIRIQTITVHYALVESGIADIELGEEAPAEYYNLQGVRMEGELTPGLYIRRQGNKATKVIVK